MARDDYDGFVDNYNYIIMLHLHEIFQLMAERFGKAPLCNGRADRAPHIFGKCFILCWRCTSLIFTVLLCSFLCWLFMGSMYAELEIHEILYALILIYPTAVDGILQYFFQIESTNARRIIFGFISGIGLWMFASWVKIFLLSGWLNKICFWN